MIFTEAATPEEADAIRAKLPPAQGEIGQKVWWNRTWGEIFEGRVRYIELGTIYDSGHEYIARRYRVQSERVSDSRGEGKVRDNPYEWTSCYQTEHEGVYKFTFDHDKAKKKAVQLMTYEVNDLRRRALQLETNAKRIQESIGQ